ncbi:class I SAM-dependent methyltransferase [Sulfurimonas sp.]|uniref:class I SAM-dependent methyltransferase n=1 Tax=Sulfurimonas sp. TaxID=2022749 RepID=UPI0035691205
MINKNDFDGSLKFGVKEFIKNTKRDVLASKQLEFRKSLIDINNNLLEGIYDIRSCPCCDSDKYILIFKKLGFSHVKCIDCNMIYTLEVLKDDVVEEYYKLNELNDEHHKMINAQIDNKLDILRFDYCLNEILKHFNTPNNILDIGCGTGLFLERAKLRGLQPVGVELNNYAKELTSKRGIAVYGELIENIKFKEKFDIVTLWTVLEHIVNPKNFIENIISNMNDKSLLIIEVPNINGFATSLLREKSSTFAGDQHVTFFSLETMTKFLENFGFELLHAQTYISEIRTAVNYLNYEDPYSGETPLEKYPNITPEWIHHNLMGHRLFAIFSLNKKEL